MLRFKEIDKLRPGLPEHSRSAEVRQQEGTAWLRAKNIWRWSRPRGPTASVHSRWQGPERIFGCGAVGVWAAWQLGFGAGPQVYSQRDGLESR